jgi:hypothetical protein
MSTKKIRINIKDITDSIAENYFVKLSDKNPPIIFSNNEEKRKKIIAIKRKTCRTAAILGALGVIILYVPQYVFPMYFHTTSYTVPLIHYSFELSVFEMLYGFVLVGIEIWLLMKGDLEAVNKISSVYQYKPKKGDIDTIELVNIGLGKDQRKFNEIGINPYQNLPKFSLLFLRGIFMLKAFLSNFVFRIILKRVLGRIAVRAVIDLAGIPIYALWNAWASSTVIRKADMRMQALNQMNKTGKHFYSMYNENKTFKNLLYDTFGYIALTKKSFHPTDMIFAKHFLNLFNIDIKDEHILRENFLEEIKTLNDDMKLAIGQLLILGFLLDGKIGKFEERLIKKLQKEKIIPYSLHQIKNWTKEYRVGKGFDEMFDYSLT